VPSPTSQASPEPVPVGGAGRRADLLLGLGLVLAVLLLQARTFGWPALDLDGSGGRASTRPWSAESATAAWRLGGPAGLVALAEHALTDGVLALQRAAHALLHGLSAAFLFATLRRLGAGRGAGALVAALFALHPLRTAALFLPEAPATVLASFLFLLGLWLRVRRGASTRSLARRPETYASLAAVLVEPRLCLFPLAVAALEAASGKGRARLLEGLVFLLPGLFWLLAAPRPAEPAELGLAVRLAAVPAALARIAWTALAPLDLTFFQPHPALGGGSGLAIWGWAPALASLAALAWWRARLPLAFAGAAWFLALALPPILWPGDEGFASPTGAYLAATGLELVVVLHARAALARAYVPGAARATLGWAWLLTLLLVGARQLGGWSSTRAVGEHALALDDSNYRAHDVVGLAHFAAGRLSEAARAHERALALRPSDGLALRQLGAIELRRGLIPGQEAHLAAARAGLARALEAHEDVLTLELLGEAEQRTGQADEATATLTRAVALDPASAVAWTRLGMLGLARRDADGARAAFERATRLRPDLAEGWCGLGLVRFQEQALAEAEDALRRALALEPDQVEARAALGRIREELGDRAAAEREYRHAVGVNPDYADALFALGALCEGDGRGEEALRCYERLTSLQPHVRAQLGIARLRLQRGERELARSALEAVLRLNPEQAEARVLLDRVRDGGDAR